VDEGPRNKGGVVSVFVTPGKISLGGPGDTPRVMQDVFAIKHIDHTVVSKGVYTAQDLLYKLLKFFDELSRKLFLHTRFELENVLFFAGTGFYEKKRLKWQNS